MSTTIDERVVEMRFDNKHFESNVATSMSTLEKLKQKLNLSGATKGLEDINSAAGKVNMSGLGSGVDAVKAKFSALDVVAVTALANITNKAVDAGIKLTKSLSVDQVTAGWQKFSDKTTSVATLVAQGNAIEDVNAQLDLLNWYTDETSYNFTDMVSNIAKFTATGQDLETSVTAMEGIANWAALSGQNASTASRAMYQLSQAMGAGVMRLEDYKSIQNASMDTEEFRQKCLDAAVSLGTLKDNGDGTYTSLVEGASDTSFSISQFTTQLTEGMWLTSDVMMDVFNNYSSAVSGIYEATESTGKLASEIIDEVHDKADELKTDTMTDEEAINAAIKELGYTLEDGSLMFDSFGLKAFESAQKARTFTDAIDSVKDAVSTGWMNTFELIFGDAEKATELWTDLANTLYDVFAASGEVRNWILEIALNFAEPWTAIKEKLEGISTITDKVENVTKTVSNAAEKLEQFQEVVSNIWRGDYGNGESRFSLLEGEGWDSRVIQELVNKGNDYKLTIEDVEAAHKKYGLTLETTTEETKKTIDATNEATSAFENLTDEQLEQAGLTEEEIALYRALQKEADRLGISMDELAEEMSTNDGRTLLIDSFKNIGSVLLDTFTIIKQAFADIFDIPGAEELAVRLYGIIKSFSEFTEKLRLTDKETGKLTDAGKKLQRTFKGIFAILDVVKTLVSGGLKVAFEVLKSVLDASGFSILDTTANIGDALVKFREWLLENNGLAESIDNLVDKIPSLVNNIKEWFAALKESTAAQKLADAIDAIREAIAKLISGGADLSGFTTSFDSVFGVLKGLWSIITKVGSAIIKAFGSIGSTISEILGKGDIFEVLNTGLIAGILLGIQKFTSGLKDAVDNVGDFTENIVGVLDDVRGCLEAYQQQLKAGTLLKIAGAVALLAGSLFLLSTIDADSLGTAIAAITALFAELVGSMALMNKFGGKSSLFDTTAVKMIAMSVAILILAAALKSLSGLSWEQMAVGLVAVSALLWELVAVSIVMSKTGSKMVKGSIGLIALAIAIKILASACKDFTTMSWEEIGKGLATIGSLLLELSIFENIAGKAKHVVSTGLSMILIAASLKILASALSDFGTMDPNTIVTGLLTIGAALLELSIAMNLMPKNSMLKATGLVIAIASLKLLANVMDDFSGMKWDGIGKGLVVIGGALAELAIGLNLMRGTLSGAAALLVASAALAIITPVMTSLGNMSWEQIAKGLITLAGAFAVIGIAGLLLQPLITPILLLSAAFAILGVGMIGIGAGLVLISAGISALGTALAAGAVGVVAGLTVIVTGILDLIPSIARIIGEGIVEIAKVIGEYTPQLADSFLKLLLGVLESLAENAPQITDALFELLIGIINSLSTHTPALIEALANLFANVFVGLVDALKSMGLNSIRDGLDIALGLSALMLAMSVALKIAGSISIGSAIKGVIALTAMAIPLVAFVAVLALASGVDNAMDNVLALTVLAGACTLMLLPLTLVGAFIGPALLGVVALTAMAIPMLAFVGILALMNSVDNAMVNAILLGSFMTIMANVLVKVALVAPLAILGVAAMDGLVLLMGAVGAMAVAVGALMEKFPAIQDFLDTGLPVLEQLAGSIGTMIGEFIGGIGEGLGDSLVKIGEDISAFMDQLAVASDNASGIKGESFDGVKDLMLVMAEIGGTSIITGVTDLFSSFLSGESSMDKFRKDGVVFFEAMGAIGEASSEVKIDEESMNSVIGVAEKLVELQSSLEPIGGVISWFTGRDDLGTFGVNAAKFVSSMVTAFGTLDGATLNTEAMDTVVDAATNLAELQTSLEPIGGVISWFTGRDDLGTFGISVGLFIESMVTAFASLNDTELNTEAMDTIVDAATSLAELQSSLEPIGGVITWFTGRDDLGTFGVNAAAFIFSMKTAFGSLEDATFNTEAMDTIISAATSLAELQSSLEPIGGVITWFTGRDDLGTFGINVGSFITSMKTAMSSLDGVMFNEEALNSIITAATKLGELQSSLEPIGGVITWFTGRDDLGTFGVSVSQFISSMKTAAESLGDTTINEEALESIIAAAKKLAEFQDTLEPMGGVVSWFTGRDDLGTFGTNIGLFADAMAKLKTGMGEDGISEAVVASVINAGTAITELQKALPEESWFDGKMNLSEFSDYVTDFATAMETFGTKAVEIDSGAVSTVIDTAYRIKSLIESLVDLDTSGVDAFTGIGSGGIGADGPAYDIACAIAKFGDKVADIDTEAVTVAVSAAGKLKTLIAGLVGLDTSGIENFKPGTIGDQMKAYSDKVAGIDTGTVSSSISAANRLKNFIAGLVDLDTSGVSKFKPGAIGSSLKTYTAAIAGFDVGTVNSSISAANRLKNFISSLADLDSSGVSSFKSAVESLAEVNLSGIQEAFDSAATQLAEAGSHIMDSIINGMESRTVTVIAACTALVSNMQKIVIAKVVMFNVAGLMMMTHLSKGILSGRSTVISATTSSLSAAATATRVYYYSFYSAGSYLVTGFANGISANAYKAVAKARVMAQAAAQAAKNALDINSPSKVFKKIGASIPEGFAMGIGMLSGMVEKSSVNMANTALDKTKTAIQHVSDMMSTNADYQPTITPVLDLSNVESGAGSIASMFNSNPSIGLTGNIKAASVLMNENGQNGMSDEIVSAINRLRKDLGNVGNTTYSINGVTYDDGSNIQDAISAVVRQARIERRV